MIGALETPPAPVQGAASLTAQVIPRLPEAGKPRAAVPPDAAARGAVT